jgi:hypothetical protein
MLKVDGVNYLGVVVKCRVCETAFEVKAYEQDSRVLCGSEECKRLDVNDRMRKSRLKRKAECLGCKVLEKRYRIA